MKKKFCFLSYYFHFKLFSEKFKNVKRCFELLNKTKSLQYMHSVIQNKKAGPIRKTNYFV